MDWLRKVRRDGKGTAAAEMAMIAPVLLALMFGSFELGNLFLVEHALAKQVRDGARYAARLPIDADYSCPTTVFADADANTKIVNVTKTGAVTGDGNPRWTDYWTRNCTGETGTLEVTIRCVAKEDIDTDETGYTGIYTTLEGDDIPVVTVAGAVKYRSVLAELGFDTTDLCLRAESEAAVVGS